MKKPLLTIEKTVSTDLADIAKALGKKALYVGIAKGSEGDKREEEKAPPNHLLGYVHEFGSPAHNIPARPFLVPSVQGYQAEIVKQMSRAMQYALEGNEEACDVLLEKTAMRTASEVKKYMETADFVPLQPSTIANRNRSRMTQSKRQEEIDMDISSIKPLINTGALRDAIDGYFISE